MTQSLHYASGGVNAKMQKLAKIIAPRLEGRKNEKRAHPSSSNLKVRHG
jgi:hypothetical protein